MRRTTLVSAEETGSFATGRERGSLKVFFSYAPCSGTTAAMIDEASGLIASGRDVFVADPACATGGLPSPFDLDQVLKRRPDVVVLEDLAFSNPPEARNRTRYQDAEELLRAGIDVYATLRVADLQNEQDRVRALGVKAPAEPVPDYMFYGARQLEFVDIDPAELLARAKAANREVPEQALNDLRILALRCVSEYASSASAQSAPQGSDPAESEQTPLYNLVVAVVEPGLAPGDVLLEATRLAGAARADLEVVCVRNERRFSAATQAAWDEEAYETLVDQVEAMGLELVTYYGDDPAELVRDYLRTQGASDVVLARRPRSLLSRVLMPLQAPYDERVVEGLANVSVHLVANPTTAPEKPGVRGVSALAGVRLRDVFVAAAAVVLALLAAAFLQALGSDDAVSYVVFMGAFVAVALLTRSYIASLAAVAVGCLVQDYYFMESYLGFAIDDHASFIAFVAFAAVAAACTFAVVGVGRSAARSVQRERRTQALFDLNRSLMYAHGTAEVVDLSLNSVVRLFERSAAVYLDDPFAQGRAGERDHRAEVRSVLDDVADDAFHKITEQAIAHWVFVNAEPAGSTTSTHGESDLYYLPLKSQEGIEGVLVVSAAARALSLADRSFLDLVANQATLALERQSLAAKHREDLGAMHVTRIRSAFVDKVIASAAVSNNTVHAISDMIASSPEDDALYREVLARTASEESARSRLMIDRVRSVLETPVSPQCDVRHEVATAVDEVREGLVGKVIDLEPGDPVPPVAADAALVRAAVRLVLEASTSYVGARGIVQVSVTAHPDRINVVVADDRAAQAASTRAAAFDLSTRAGHEGEPFFDEARSQVLLDALRDRAAVSVDQQAPLAALCRAMRLPEAAARSEGDRGSALNRQRVLRYDRLEYGLYMAALVIHAHGGTVKQRYRLGGGSVVTFTLPRA